MNLPAVAIAAAFASGIALGLHPAVLPHVTSLPFLAVCFAASLVLILAGLVLAKIERLFPAAAISLLSWALLGVLGACVAEQQQTNHVTSFLEQNRVSLDSPLRWHGHLRDEPARLPWGGLSCCQETRKNSRNTKSLRRISQRQYGRMC